MYGYSRRNTMKNEASLGHAKVEMTSMMNKMREARLKWFEYV